MNSLFGQTRTFVGPRHALLSVDGHVASPLPGVENVRTVAHITPAMGARFSQYSLFFESTGTARLSGGDEMERVLFLVSGKLDLAGDAGEHSLRAGSFVYLHPATEVSLRATGTEATLVVFEKRFEPLPGGKGPGSLVGHADEVEGKPFLGNARALLQVLLPDVPAFDLAVNIFTYEPGATLPFVETHIMEHGLLMLSGQGIYRLEDKWYPVTAGDVIWMAPFCPQWFVAMGDAPASYLYYKNVNRPFTA
jgi:(S)-ureidoglycine aminohydrolase